ncbi:MAG: zf-HC2 domain-containing protein [Firmicutes bacterium]|nr:zf-HC2 domain-containing protein [Bacillota bacterium]
MNCQVVQNLLSAYVDQELPPEDYRRIRLHLEECAVCRREWESLRQVKLFLNGLPELPVPKQFWAELDARLAAEAGESPEVAGSGGHGGHGWPAGQARQWWKQLVPAAVAFLLVLGGSQWLRDTLQVQPPVEENWPIESLLRVHDQYATDSAPGPHAFPMVPDNGPVDAAPPASPAAAPADPALRTWVWFAEPYFPSSYPGDSSSAATLASDWGN